MKTDTNNNIITVYRVNSGYANVQDNLTLRRPSSEYIYSELRVILPAGYTLGETTSGEPAVFDLNDEHCAVCLNSRHGNTVLLVNAGGYTALRYAPDEAQPIPLREARLKAGLTQQQLSDASGVNARQIRRVEIRESEAGNLTAKNLLAIADALGVDPHKLI